MNGFIIRDLPNEEYHDPNSKYGDYLSSTQLKHYLRSPAAFRYAIDHPEPQTDALRFGSLFHSAMQLFQQHGTIDAFWDSVAIFQPPTNPKTNQPYGVSTKAYTEAYAKFMTDNQGKYIATLAEVELIDDMVGAVVRPCIGGTTAKQVLSLLKWGKPEVSHFVEIEGCKCKFRPDLETGKKIIDYKTIATDDLSERSINNIIAKYGYDISAAYYLYLEHEQSGIWKTFYWLFVSKVPPYDAVLVDASEWTYKYDPETDIVMPQVGAIKMKRLLDLHIKCTKENHWPGAEINIPADDFGRRIMRPTPPPWEINNASNILEQSFNEI